MLAPNCAIFGVARCQRQDTGGRNINTGCGGQGHGGMLNERRVHRAIELAELDYVWVVNDLQQALQLRRHGCLQQHVFNRFGQLRQLVELPPGRDAGSCGARIAGEVFAAGLMVKLACDPRELCTSSYQNSSRYCEESAQ
jgi:hypothetical protein